MDQNWVLIFSSTELYQVKLAEDILKQEGIVSNIINHQDSAIPSIGEARLFTPEESALEARAILKSKQLLD